MKRISAILLSVMITVLLVPSLVYALTPTTEQALAERMGKTMPDFTIDTVNGEPFCLSEELEEHELVLLNFWATWCPPCAREFPYMEEAYSQYSDRVSILALSIDPNDTDEMIRNYAEKYDLTFAVGSDRKPNIASNFITGSIPTTVVIDRFGNIALVEVGAKSDAADFTALFDYFLSEDYTETTVLNTFPKAAS